jgi:hypothetical protein
MVNLSPLYLIGPVPFLIFLMVIKTSLHPYSVRIFFYRIDNFILLFLDVFDIKIKPMFKVPLVWTIP